MQIRSKNGVTLPVLVLTVVVLIILMTVGVKEVGNIMEQVNLETIETDLLIVQAKAKVIAEKSNFNSDEALLKGQKISEITGNERLQELKSKGIINEADANYENYYLWDKETVESLSIGITEMEEDDFFIVNYETEEVIYPIGYQHSDGNTYYKLTEIVELN